MNIEPDIFDYLETTSLEPHDDYTSEITYKDQKIIWNKLKEQDKEIKRLKKREKELEENLSNMVNINIEYNNTIVEAIDYIEQHNDYFLLKREVKKVLEILKGVDKE